MGRTKQTYRGHVKRGVDDTLVARMVDADKQLKRKLEDADKDDAPRKKPHLEATTMREPLVLPPCPCCFALRLKMKEVKARLEGLLDAGMVDDPDVVLPNNYLDELLDVPCVVLAYKGDKDD